MKSFINDNFLLNNNAAVEFYNNFAKDMPVFDYHNHLSPKDIAENKHYDNIVDLWLKGDHYKYRLMRAMGIDEVFITGDSNSYEKFEKWIYTLEHAIGNPIYHWAYMELSYYFGIDYEISSKNAKKIYDECNKKLQNDKISVQYLLEKTNVKALCTTDDPIDSLEYHKAIQNNESFKIVVLPTYRPDKLLYIEKAGFKEYMLNFLNGKNITLEDILDKILETTEYFKNHGCVVADVAIEEVFYEEATKEEVNTIFLKVMTVGKITKLEIAKYKTYILLFLGQRFCVLNWAMQLHIGVIRNNNTLMFKKLGTDSGFDSINDNFLAHNLSKLLDAFHNKNSLPKTIIYSLNPKDNYVIATMIGNFQCSPYKGNMQWGVPWWFNDNKDGIIRFLKDLSNLGMLATSIGMLTDSRSFLSFVRHDYFRRILCNFIGDMVDKSEIYNNKEFLGKIIQDICFNNSEEYFGLNPKLDKEIL